MKKKVKKLKVKKLGKLSDEQMRSALGGNNPSVTTTTSSVLDSTAPPCVITDESCPTNCTGAGDDFG
ncbi:MAG TPA: hypothetical protein DCS93_05225 [Microscillaceae bacterium]|nr:hypothetical protein [Microscillaceae bacterium]